MEFLSKYELRERITSGPIEVFLSQELRTGLSRLVHVLEWKENAEDLSSQEILELIRRWAPEPPGIILEAGRDPKISYAYLVTTLPADPLAVQAWVQAYERLAKGIRGNSFAKALQALKAEEAALSEPPAQQERGRHESDAVTAALDISSLSPPTSGATKSSAEPGEFTRAFGEVAAPQPKVSSGQFPVADAAAPKVPADRDAVAELGRSSEAWTRRETGAFTKEFLGVLGDGPAELDASNSSGAKHDTRPPGTFTREFMGLGQKQPSAPAPASSELPFPPSFGPTSPRTEGANILSDIDIPVAKPEYSPLERNPYRGKKAELDAGSPIGPPMGSQKASQNQKQNQNQNQNQNQIGEFTDFFGGASTQRPGDPTGRLPLPEENRLPEPDRGFRSEPSRPGKDLFDDEFFANSSKPAPSTFTENLKPPEPRAAPKVDRSARSPVPKFDSEVDLSGGGKSQNYTAPVPANFGGNRSPNLDPGASASIPEPVWDRPAEPAGATKVFASPREGPAPNSAPLDDGPSEFTMIQSGNQLLPPPPPGPPSKLRAARPVSSNYPRCRLHKCLPPPRCRMPRKCRTPRRCRMPRKCPMPHKCLKPP